MHYVMYHVMHRVIHKYAICFASCNESCYAKFECKQYYETASTWKHKNTFCIREGFKKRKKGKKWIYPFGLAGWGQQGAKIQPKMIRMV